MLRVGDTPVPQVVGGEVHGAVLVEIDLPGTPQRLSWTASPAESQELARRLLGASPAAPPDPLPALGYRGFVVTNPDRHGDLPALLRVWRGVLVITDQGVTACYEDIHDVDSWLREQARQHGYGPARGSSQG